MSRSNKSPINSFDIKKLVWTIGFQLTAYISHTDIRTVHDWLENGLPGDLEARMRATFEVAQPIAEVESELVAQGFLIGKQDNLEPYRFPATMLRDADVAIARDVLTKLARKEFLDNVACDLEALAQRLHKWIAQNKMPANTAYSVLLWSDRLSLSLLHAGFSIEQQCRWDRGEDWPSWDSLATKVPEISVARICPDLQTGFPFRYLRRSAT